MTHRFLFCEAIVTHKWDASRPPLCPSARALRRPRARVVAPRYPAPLMLGPRDRYFAELVVARRLATWDALRKAAMGVSAGSGIGSFPHIVVRAGVVTEDQRVHLELLVDAARRSCACGELVYAPADVGPVPSPRCRKGVGPPLPSTRPDLGSPPPSSGPGTQRLAQPEAIVYEPRSQYGPYEVIQELG